MNVWALPLDDLRDDDELTSIHYLTRICPIREATAKCEDHNVEVITILATKYFGENK